MPFVPKDWRDWPDVSTPLAASAIKDLEQRVANYSDHVAARGAAGTALLKPTMYVVEECGGSPLTTPTYEGSGQGTHPSVVYVANGWNGYRYWMAFTPYPNANEDHENPSVLVSNDGNTWVVPPGLTNPIDPDPGGSDINSDTELVLSPDGTTLHLVWRAVETAPTPDNDVYYLVSSTDGVTWSTPVAILTTPITTFRAVSPTIWWDAPTEQWVMIAIDFLPGSNALMRWTADDIAGPWTLQTAPTVSGSFPSGREMWHIYAADIGGTVIAVVNDTSTGVSGSGGSIFMMRSVDAGITWTLSGTPLIKSFAGWDERMYRSCFVPLPDGDLDLFEAGFVGGGGAWRIGRCRVTSAAKAPSLTRLGSAADQAAASSGNAPWIIGDRFRRADAGAIGTMDSGQTWTAVGAWGILSNQAYISSASNAKLTYNLGIADFYSEVEFPAISGGVSEEQWMLFRVVDNNNFLRFGVRGGGQICAQKVSGGSATDFALCGLYVLGDRLCVWANGSTMWFGLNGQRRYKVTDSTHSTATTVGLQFGYTNARAKNFRARSLIDGV